MRMTGFSCGSRSHACRSSDDTSRRLRDALEDRAREGRPHSSGQRPYGYAPDAVTVIDEEAVIIREIYALYLDGASPGLIARELNQRGRVTVSGVPWQPYAVRAVLASRQCDRPPGVPGPGGRGGSSQPPRDPPSPHCAR